MDFNYYKLLSVGSLHIEILSLVHITPLKRHTFNGDSERELCIIKAKSQLCFN